MSTLKDRLLFLIEKEKMNPNQFYIKTGLANGFLDKVGSKMNRSTIEKIERAFPHWNLDYLIYGEGEMINPRHVNITGDGNVTNTGHVGGSINPSSPNNDLNFKPETYLSIINGQQQTINSLHQTIERLSRIIENLTNK